MNGHQRIEEQSIWLHRAVADKLRQDSAILARASASWVGLGMPRSTPTTRRHGVTDR